MVIKSRDNLKKLLKEIISLIVGKPSENIADLLDSNKHVNEFIIAKKLGITINQTRNILYKIADEGLVSSIRKKDKRKGWYTYFWKLETSKALEFLRESLLKKIEQVKSQIKSRETKQFYFCELCNVEFTEENALLKDFTCSECGNVFSIKDNVPVLKELGKTLGKLESELVMVDEEFKLEKDKVDKERTKVTKKREKEEKTKRKIARDVKAKLKAAENKEKVLVKKIKKPAAKKSRPTGAKISKKNVASFKSGKKKKRIVNKAVAKKKVAKKKVSRKK